MARTDPDKPSVRRTDPLGTLLHDTAVLRADLRWLITLVTERLPRTDGPVLLPERRASAMSDASASSTLPP
jgi:hypothetical protein